MIYGDPHRIWHRVMARVEKTDSGCWLWPGALNSKGYGCVGSGRRSRTVLVHRLAIIVRDGHLDPDLTVDHMCHHAGRCAGGKGCDHRRCVNPDHLKVVSRADNSARAGSPAERTAASPSTCQPGRRHLTHSKGSMTCTSTRPSTFARTTTTTRG